MATYVINLEKDQIRRGSVERELQKVGIKPRFIVAYDGHDRNFPFHKYQCFAGLFWRKKNQFKPGAFACYLSHIKCWKEFINSDESHCMILEDDVLINANAYFNFSMDNMTERFDVIFITESTVNLAKRIKHKKVFLSASTLLKHLVFNSGGTDSLQAIGSYGYILSKKGASKLLKMVNSRKISMGIDFAMFFNSLNLDDIRSLLSLPQNELPSPLNIFIEKERKHLSDGEPFVQLKSYIYTPEIIIDRGEFPSSIHHDIYLSNDVFKKQ